MKEGRAAGQHRGQRGTGRPAHVRSWGSGAERLGAPQTGNGVGGRQVAKGLTRDQNKVMTTTRCARSVRKREGTSPEIRPMAPRGQGYRLQPRRRSAGLKAQEGPLLKSRPPARKNSTAASFPLALAPPSCLGNRVRGRGGQIPGNLARAVSSPAAAAFLRGASRGWPRGSRCGLRSPPLGLGGPAARGAL